jgi:hypothetical protein
MFKMSIVMVEFLYLLEKVEIAKEFRDIKMSFFIVSNI